MANPPTSQPGFHLDKWPLNDLCFTYSNVQIFFLSWIPKLATGGLMAYKEYCTGLHMGSLHGACHPWAWARLLLWSVWVKGRACPEGIHAIGGVIAIPSSSQNQGDVMWGISPSMKTTHAILVTNVFGTGSGQQLHGKPRDCSSQEEKRGLQGREGRRQTRLLRFAYHWKHYCCWNSPSFLNLALVSEMFSLCLSQDLNTIEENNTGELHRMQ